MKYCKKILAIFLVTCMVLTVNPVHTFAAINEKNKKSVYSEPKNVYVEPKMEEEETERLEGNIVREITENRQENIKYFLKDNNTYEAVIYPKPVHYMESGQWKDINNDLVDKEENVEELITNELTAESNNSKSLIKENGNSKSLSGKNSDSKSLNENNKKIRKKVVKKGFLENTKNDFKVKIAKDLDEKDLMTITKGQYQIKWGLDRTKEAKVKKKSKAQKKAKDVKELEKSVKQLSEDTLKRVKSKKLSKAKKEEQKNIIEKNEKKKTLSNVSSSVKFEEIYPNIDLEYDVVSKDVKETIIINKETEKTNFQFNLNAKNLLPKLEKDNVIVFYDKNNTSTEIFKIDAPYMIDAKGEKSTDIVVKLEENKKGYILSLIPNEQWMQKSERQYPIKIDPSVETSTNVNDIKDTFVGEGYPTKNYGQAHLLETGYGKYSKRTRTYIKFDNLPKLTSSDIVVKAQLNLQLNKSNSKQYQVNAYKPKANWNSLSITWRNQPGYDLTVLDYQLVKDAKWYSWDITKLVKEWYTKGQNYGIALQHKNEGSSAGYNEFVSSDISSQYHYARPTVSIGYVSNAGLENYWTYHSHDVGRAGEGCVNDSTGNLVFVHEDLSMNGNKMPIAISHVFNSNEKNNSIGYGKGWRLNISQRIAKVSNQNKYVYTDGDGTRHYLNYDSKEKKYKDESGIDISMTIDSSNVNERFRIKDKGSNQLTFTASGYLKKIIDNNGNALTLSYSGAKLIQVTDGAGRVTKLDVNNNGYLIGITDPSGRKISFAYGGINLTRITYPDGKYTVYRYDSNSNLVGADNFDGYKVSYSYSSVAPQKVTKVQEIGTDGKLGQKLEMEYGYNTTVFKDSKGRKEIYQFNDYGNTVSIRDDEGNALYYQYKDKLNKNNKLSLQSKLQKPIMNYLKNHNVENNGEWSLGDWTGAKGSGEITSTNSYLGSKSLKITKTNNVSRNFYGQTLSLEKGKTYTLSSYIKTKNISNTNGAGATVFVNYQKNDGKWETVNSKYINGTNDWERHEVKFTVPKDAASTIVYARVGIVGEMGDAYFDCLQLEDGAVANRYNLVENPNFTYYLNNWNKSSYCTSNDKVVTTSDSTYPSILGKEKRVATISGEATKDKSIYQYLNVSGKKGDVFVVGGWAKANSVRIRYPRYFALDVGFQKSDGGYEWHVISFNEDSSQWQYACDRIKANSDYKNVIVYCLYYQNENYAYFDGIQFYKEEFGESYQYDEKGNVISTSDLAEKKSKFEYDGNNDLIKSVSPKGSEFKYKYDSKHNLLNATSGENVVYSFEYDSSGNAKKAKIGSNTLFMQSKAEYTSDGNYLKSMTDSSGNTVQYNYDTKKGTLKSATDAKGNSISYEYDNLDRLIKTKGKASSSTEAVNSYSYSNDKLKNIGHNDFNYSFDYDAFGRNSKVNISNGNGTKNLIENIYEQVTGMLKTSKYGNGHVINYKYDNSDRVSEISYSGGSTSQGSFSYEYDASGNLANHYDKVNNVNYRYIYDAADRLVKIKDSKGDTLKYGYDEDNNVSSINEKINNNSYVTKYEYDNDNKLSKVHYNTKGQSSEKTETFPLNNSLKSLSGIEPYSQNTIFEKDETTGRNVLGAYEGSKNLIPNSSFEDGTKSWRISDWNRFSGNCRIVDDGVKGSKCIESYDTKGSSGTSNTNSVAYQEITFSSPLSTAKEYTLSAYAKRIGASQPKLSVECIDSSGKQLYYLVDTKEIPERQWKRISHTFTLPAKTKMCRVIIRTGVKNTDVVRFDGVQFEEKGFAAPYTSSSSNATKILYNLNVNKNAGTMGTWFKTRKKEDTRYMIVNEGKNTEILLMYIGNDNKLNIATRKKNTMFTNIVTSKETIEEDKWYFAAMTWQLKDNKLTAKLYLNDKLVGEGTTDDFMDFTKGSTALGSTTNGTYQINGNLEQFTYSSQTLSEEQISNLYKNTLTSNSTLSLNYDSLGRMISKKLSTGLKDYITKYEFEAGKEANTATSIVKSIDNGGEKLYYTYDKNGNIETIVQNKGTEKEKTIKYHYDGLNQITREDNGILGKTITYSYDGGGNLTVKRQISPNLNVSLFL